MSKELITISGVSGVTLDITAQALVLKQQAISKAQAITAVTDSDSQSQAAESLSEIKGILKTLEKSRKEIKAPVLDLGKRIDSKADEFARALDAEAERLNAHITTFYRAEKEKADAERRMVEELERKRREKAEAIAKAHEEEQKRLEQEAAKARTTFEAKELSDQAQRAAASAEAAREKAAETTASPIPVAPKADKMVAKTTWKHRIVSLEKLYHVRPDLVTLEPKTAKINEEIRGGLRQLQGVEIFEETDISVRA